MRAGSLGKGHPLPLELRHLANLGISAHDNGLRLRRGRLARIVGKVGTRGQRERRHGIGHIGAQVQVAEVQGFQQRQPRGELIPLHRDAVGRQRLLQRLPRLQQDHQRGGLLVADAQRGLALGQGRYG
ncbi:hypothetical protein D3C72_1894180 [compost metagenome]